MAQTVLEIVLNGVRRQAETVTRFVTQPVGIFETVDQVVRNTRKTAKDILETVGVRAPSTLLRGSQR
ncbi:MAG: hypothetical protein QW356_04625 [Candidatus Hadarchaeales archaeon]